MATTEPTEEQIKELLSGEQEGPFHFVNLLKFKEFASYPSDHALVVSSYRPGAH